MSYIASRVVLEGLKTVVAMEENVSMPAVEDVIKELDFLSKLIADSEKFYGVPFRGKQKEFHAVEDIKAFLEEFYFGEGTRNTHSFRPRAMYRLIMEPLMDELAQLSHDQVLDYAVNVIEQLKERAVLYRMCNTMDYRAAYAQYQQMANARQNEKKIKQAVAGVMKLRAKSLSLFKQLARKGQPAYA